jgi:hypothetical protein
MTPNDPRAVFLSNLTQQRQQVLRMLISGNDSSISNKALAFRTHQCRASECLAKLLIRPD